MLAGNDRRPAGWQVVGSRLSVQPRFNETFWEKTSPLVFECAGAPWAAVGAPMLGSSEKAKPAGPLSLRLRLNPPTRRRWASHCGGSGAA